VDAFVFEDFDDAADQAVVFFDGSERASLASRQSGRMEEKMLACSPGRPSPLR